MEELVIPVVLTVLPIAAIGANAMLQSRRLRSHEAAIEAANRMAEEKDGVKISVYDLKSANSYGRRHFAMVQTVFEISSAKLSLPKFKLEPENVLHKVAEKAGAQDIDFDSHPLFSDRYLLRGESEEQIRKTFTTEVLAWFEQHLGLTVESAGDRLLIHKSRMLDPSEIEASLALAREVHDLFA